MSLKSKIRKSLAGTNRQYHEVEGAEGFRIRSMKIDGRPELFRIHMAHQHPEINSRTRLDKKEYKIPYYAIDIRVDALQEGVRLALKEAGYSPFQHALDTLDAQIAKAQETAKKAQAEAEEVSAQRSSVAKAKEIYDTLS